MTVQLVHHAESKSSSSRLDQAVDVAIFPGSCLRWYDADLHAETLAWKRSEGGG